MYNLKAKLVSLLFRLKPAIKSSVGNHKYQKTLNSFEEHFGEIDTRVNQEKGILAFHRMFLITMPKLRNTTRYEDPLYKCFLKKKWIMEACYGLK